MTLTIPIYVVLMTEQLDELARLECDFLAALRNAAPGLIAAARELERLKPVLVEWAKTRDVWQNNYDRAKEDETLGRYEDAKDALRDAIPAEWLEQEEE